MSDRSETPRIWVSGILDGLWASPSLSLDTVQALVFSGVCCRIHWTLPSRTRQNHPHQTWSFHLHQLSHHAYVHCNCHKDHRVCLSDGEQPWLLQNCLHPRIFPNLEEKERNRGSIIFYYLPNNSSLMKVFEGNYIKLQPWHFLLDNLLGLRMEFGLCSGKRDTYSACPQKSNDSGLCFRQ